MTPTKDEIRAALDDLEYCLSSIGSDNPYAAEKCVGMIIREGKTIRTVLQAALDAPDPENLRDSQVLCATLEAEQPAEIPGLDEAIEHWRVGANAQGTDAEHLRKIWLAARLYAQGRSKPVDLEAWQPIETAPKDGTIIIGMDDFGEIERVYWDGSASEDYIPEWMSKEQRGPASPKFWIPFPDNGYRIVRE